MDRCERSAVAKMDFLLVSKGRHEFTIAKLADNYSYKVLSPSVKLDYLRSYSHLLGISRNLSRFEIKIDYSRVS